MKIKIYFSVALVMALTTLLLTTGCPGTTTETIIAPSCNGALNTSLNSTTPTGTPINALPVTVGCGYTNEPCVTVTICTPGVPHTASSCQTIPNVLLDTGSYGLRLFTCAVTVPLVQEMDPNNSANQVAEQVFYADGTCDWGLVKTADVVLGGETASNVPIQIIDSTFSTLQPECTSPDVGPNFSGYNGILGVGLFTNDCGDCNVADNRQYFSCSGTNCGVDSVVMPVNVTAGPTTTQYQVTNPVSMLPSPDNNGVALDLPAIANVGVTSAIGTLWLGVGTPTGNNTPTDSESMTATQQASICTGAPSTPGCPVTVSPIMVLQTDTSGYINTTYATQPGPNPNPSSFFDSGSNGIFFADVGLPQCQNDYSSGFYCPNLTTAKWATVGDLNNANQFPILFNVINANEALLSTYPYFIFNDLAGVMPNAFDWGLPIYFGHKIYLGFDGQPSTIDTVNYTGPFWAM